MVATSLLMNSVAWALLERVQYYLWNMLAVVTESEFVPPTMEQDIMCGREDNLNHQG